MALSFCTNCGSQLPDGALVCPNCGQKVVVRQSPIPPVPVEPMNNMSQPAAPANNAPATPTPVAPVSNNAPVPPVNNVANATPANNAPANDWNPQTSTSFVMQNTNTPVKKSKIGLIIALSSIVVVAIVSIVLGIVLLGSSYEDPIKTICKLHNKRDTSYETYIAYVQIEDDDYPGFDYKAYLDMKISWNDQDPSDYEERVESKYESYDDKFGSDWEVEYEITKATQCSESTIEAYASSYESYVERRCNSIENELENYEDSDNYDKKIAKALEEALADWEKSELTDAYTVKGKLKFSGSEDKETEKFTIVIGKINGKWWVIDA